MRAPMLTLALCLAACTRQAAGEAAAPAAAETAAVHPVSGLEVIPLTVTTPGGTAHRFRVEVARTPQEQSRGLMFRAEMGADEGMLFPYQQSQVLSFWMKNTVLSLDLVFIGPDRKIVNIAKRAVPYSEASIMSAAPAIAVLELNGGRTDELNIVPGARVDW